MRSRIHVGWPDRPGPICLPHHHSRGLSRPTMFETAYHETNIFLEAVQSSPMLEECVSGHALPSSRLNRLDPSRQITIWSMDHVFSGCTDTADAAIR